MSPARVIVRFLVCALLVVPSASVAAAQESGTLSIRAQPAGAEIFIDGERWTGSGETGSLQVQLASGSHRVEVRAPGRQTYASNVTIRAGETTPLNVLLSVAAPRPEPPPAQAPQRPPSAAGRRDFSVGSGMGRGVYRREPSAVSAPVSGRTACHRRPRRTAVTRGRRRRFPVLDQWGGRPSARSARRGSSHPDHARELRRVSGSLVRPSMCAPCGFEPELEVLQTKGARLERLAFIALLHWL